MRTRCFKNDVWGCPAQLAASVKSDGTYFRNPKSKKYVPKPLFNC